MPAAKKKASRKKASRKAVSRKTTSKKASTRRQSPKKGRPTSLSKEVAERFFFELLGGEKADEDTRTLREVCALEGMPSTSTLMRWLARSDDDNAPPEYIAFRAQYARARELQQELAVDEMVQIARNATAGNAQVKRLLIDTLKWRASKMAASIYGNKLEATFRGDGKHPLTSIVEIATQRGMRPPSEEYPAE